MVFNGVMLISAAKKSAEAWQYMACIGEHQRIDGQDMVDLVLCFPLQQLGHLLLYIWSCLCVPPHPTYYVSSSYYEDDDDDSDDDDDREGFRYAYYSQASPDDESSSSSD